MARDQGRKCGSQRASPEEQKAQLTGGAVGARIARAGAVTLVPVKTKADTDTLVLAGVVATGVHCGRETEIRDHLSGPEVWTQVAALS